MRDGAEFFLLSSLVHRVKILVAGAIAGLARVDIACVALLQVTRTHFDLCLL